MLLESISVCVELISIVLTTNKEVRWFYAQLIKSSISFYAKSCENCLMTLFDTFKSVIKHQFRLVNETPKCQKESITSEKVH